MQHMEYRRNTMALLFFRRALPGAATGPPAPPSGQATILPRWPPKAQAAASDVHGQPCPASSKRSSVASARARQPAGTHVVPEYSPITAGPSTAAPDASDSRR